jgi:glyceraldehyde-3-phosphate dehydrogenase (NADP+)
MQPTIIENAPREAFVCSREAFAPLVSVFKVSSFRKAVEAVNDSIYGLQAGVFTNNLEHALYAFENIEAGGVIMNDIPTYRIDHMPYGGVKSSGLSREGIRYTIEDMTEMRLLVINRLESQRVID